MKQCYKPHFKCLLFLSVITGLQIASQNAHAVRYTTLSDNPSTQQKDTSSNQSEMECTQADLRSISRFDRIMRSKQDEAQEAIDESNKYTNQSMLETREYERLLKKIDQLQAYTESQEYLDMRVVYERCDRKTPVLVESPLWMP